MNINEILKGVNCTCGKHHTCDIEYIYVENGAISHLNELLSKYKSILLVADENTYQATGDRLEKVLVGKEATKVIFSGKTVLIPNELAIDEVEKNLKNKDIILAVGSGVIQDLCKYVAHKNSLPYMVVATAPSMDGYASSGSAMILKGMKETVPSTLPKAIIADTDVLKNAPMDMIKAGYGDIIGKYSALNDWKLSHLVNGEFMCDYIYKTTYDMIEKTLSTLDGLLKRDEESVKTLTEALMIVGIMMSFLGNSRPASGSEHHLSHFFEITGIVENKPYFPHGTDVFYSTYITAKIREKLIETKFENKLYRDRVSVYESDIREIYKEVADGCIALQEKIGNYKKDRTSVYISYENEIKAILKEMPSSQSIRSMLNKAGLEIDDFHNMYGKKKILNAIKYAKDLKDRYTVLWLFYDLLGGKMQ